MQRILVTTIASALLATPALAQQSAVTGGESTFSLTPYAGYMFFGNLADVGPNTTLTNDDSWLAGAQAKVRMTSRWSVVLNGAYSKSDFQTVTAVPGQTTTTNVGEIGYWLGDVGLEYRTPFRFRNGAVSPFLQAGVGAVRYTADANDLGSDNTTNVQFNFGGGLDIDAGPVGFQLMVKDYVTSLDWDNLRGVNYGDIATGDADRSSIANNIALTAGIRINF